jgi:hypothetical protein
MNEALKTMWQIINLNDLKQNDLNFNFKTTLEPIDTTYCILHVKYDSNNSGKILLVQNNGVIINRIEE